jgi:hypothetical protein
MYAWNPLSCRCRARSGGSWRSEARAMTVLQLQCLRCGEQFGYNPGRSGRRRLTCSPACRAARQLEHGRRYRREGRRSRGKRKLYNGACAVCSTAFVTGNRRTQTCSNACGAILNGQLRTARSLARRAKCCPVCTHSFVPSNSSASQRRSGYVQRCCSHECFRRLRRKSMTVGP